MVFFGFMVCGVLGGYIADRYGRWKVKHTLIFTLQIIFVLDCLPNRLCIHFSLCVYTCNQVVFGGFVWSAYFSLLTSFAPSYGWFVFLRSMVGCGVAGVSQGSADPQHTHTHTHSNTFGHTNKMFFFKGSGHPN